jgi:signal transduction histidine kinase
MLSHELRNPLAAVLHAVDTMQHGDAGAETTQKCRDVIGRQAKHMARLLDDLLDVSRITSGKFELRKQDMDLRGAVTAAVESSGAKLEERQIKLDVTMPDVPVTVRGDVSRLQQVIMNLLTNAANYSPTGSEGHCRRPRTGRRTRSL